MRFSRYVFAGFIAASLASGYALAQTAATEPVVRGEKIRNFARITFEWPRSTMLEASASGNVLTISFDRSAKPNLQPLLKKLSPYVTNVAQVGDDTVKITLNKPYRVRSFLSGNVNGVDILDVNGQPDTKLVLMGEPAKKTEKKPENKPLFKKPEPPKLAELPPAIVEASPSAAPPEAVGSAPTPAATPVTPQVAAAAEPKAQDEAAPQAAEPEPVARAGRVKVYGASTAGRQVLRFDWKERVAAAVFNRRGYVWIVFSKPVTLDTSALRETATALYPALKILDVPGATVVRVKSNEGTGGTATIEKDSFEWTINIISPPQPPAQPLPVNVETGGTLPAHVMLPVQERGDLVRIADPLLKDTILVVPVFTPGQGVDRTRRFVEFTLLSSTQGIVVQPLAEGITITPVLNGMKIASTTMLNLSTPVAAPSTAPAPTTDVSMLPYERWKAATTRNFGDEVSGLTASAIMAGTDEAGLNLRVELAQLYIAEGLAAEALGWVNEIKRINPNYYVSKSLSAISGAANFLMGRYADAVEDFSVPELRGNPEVAYFQNILSSQLGASVQQEDYFAAYKNFIHTYPPAFKRRLAVIAADRAVTDQRYADARQIVDTLKQEKLLEEVESYLLYVIARAAADSGEKEAANATFESLAADYKDPLVRGRAMFTLITERLKDRALEPKEAIEQLEKLRLIWRGDNLERDVLELLGELYAETENYPQALRTWQTLTDTFPNSPPATAAAPKMQMAYLKLFDEGVVDAMPPLEQIGLYYEYRNLTPSGEVGDRIIEKLADRLVKADLLEQAIALMDYRMRYLYEKETRSRAGLKLANAQLLNRNPEKAMQALQGSAYGDNPPELRRERDHAAASAMVELGRYEEVEDLLREDTSTEAERIRQRSYWRQKDWDRLSASIEATLKARRDTTAALTPLETRQIIQLAVAYMAKGEAEQLHYLRDYFTPLMPQDDAAGKLFAFITRPDVSMSPDTFEAAMKYVEDTRQFLKEYRVVQAAAAPPPEETQKN